MKLLPDNHPKVMRRLVRELNHEGFDGFYVTKAGEEFRPRCNRARMNAGTVEVRSCAHGWFKLECEAESARTGQVITASRHP